MTRQKRSTSGSSQHLQGNHQTPLNRMTRRRRSSSSRRHPKVESLASHSLEDRRATTSPAPPLPSDGSDMKRSPYLGQRLSKGKTSTTYATPGPLHHSFSNPNHFTARLGPPMARPHPQSQYPHRHCRTINLQRTSTHLHPSKETQRQKAANPNPPKTSPANSATEGRGGRSSGERSGGPREKNAAQSREESQEEAKG